MKFDHYFDKSEIFMIFYISLSTQGKMGLIIDANAMIYEYIDFIKGCYWK